MIAMSESPSQRLPNVYIGGAPKCGTTTLANYLRTHPNVFVCEPKETYYWASDMPGMRADLGIDTPQAYAKLFRHAQPQHTRLVDGTTLYLYSDRALPDIWAAHPDSRFVFAIRNPLEVAHAYHMQMVFYEQDDQPDFEAAWRLQDERKADPTIVPKRCLHHSLLQYRDVASIGSQLERAFSVLPKDRVHLIVMDDMKASPAKVYADLLEFMELPHDGKSEFTKDNAAMRARNKVLTRMMRTSTVRGITRWGKRHLSGWAYKWAKKVKNSATYKNAPREAMSKSFENELKAYFAGEIKTLDAILNRDLSHWNRDVAACVAQQD
jgi:hypothetical protein